MRFCEDRRTDMRTACIPCQFFTHSIYCLTDRDWRSILVELRVCPESDIQLRVVKGRAATIRTWKEWAGLRSWPDMACRTVRRFKGDKWRNQALDERNGIRRIYSSKERRGPCGHRRESEGEIDIECPWSSKWGCHNELVFSGAETSESTVWKRGILYSALIRE